MRHAGPGRDPHHAAGRRVGLSFRSPDQRDRRAYQSRLRQKIDRGFEPPLLHTVRGAGYMIRGTAVGKLFRATAFRLALAILALSAVGAGIVLSVIAWQVVKLVDEEIARTIEAEAKGLIDSYDREGLGGIYSVIETRKRQPGASLYLLTDPAGEPLAGNVEQIPLEVLERPGFVIVSYRTSGGGDRVRQALVRI